uniref:Uncharacterized protein n=1 Tax=Peronospora matthiolae TaxID=2874970 RepID=A0AAV1VP17_9STRA
MDMVAEADEVASVQTAWKRTNRSIVNEVLAALLVDVDVCEICCGGRSSIEL